MTVEQNQTPETQSLQQRLEQMAAAEWPAAQRTMAAHLADQSHVNGNKSASPASSSRRDDKFDKGLTECREDAAAACKQDSAATDAVAKEQVGLPTKEAFQQLVARMNKGDKVALQNVREVLDACPEIWKHAGDMGKLSEFALIKTVARKNKLAVGMFYRYVESLKREIAGSHPSALEQLAVERVVQTWLWTQHTDMACTDTNVSLSQARFWANRQDAAHRRFISAVKALTLVRTLLPSTTPRSAAPIPRLPEPDPSDTVKSSGREKAPREVSAAVSSNGRVPDESLQADENGTAGLHEGNGRLNRKPVNRIFPIRETADAK